MKNCSRMTSYHTHCKMVLLCVFLFVTIRNFWYKQAKINFVIDVVDRTGKINFVRSLGNTSKNIKTSSIFLDSVNYSTMDVLVDIRNRDFSQLFNESLRFVRNFPSPEIMMDGKGLLYDKSCASFPTLYNIIYDGNWQILSTSHGKAFLYAAYLDDRTSAMNSFNDSAIRILGMMEYSLSRLQRTNYYCQLWHENQAEPVISLVTEKRFHKTYKNGRHRLFLFSCKALNSHSHAVPFSVSLVTNACENGTNNLRVEYDKPTQKKGFAVCVKGLDFFHEDHSARLVEWIELLRILGANKIFFYEFAEHPNASKVLKYYEHTDYVDVIPLTLPGGLPNDPRLRHIYFKGRHDEQKAHEMIPYNDCLYRNMYKYKYLANLDPDETIVPLMDFSWMEMMKRLKIDHQQELNFSAAICFQNTFFFSGWKKNESWYPGIPRFMHQLQNIHRTKFYTQPQGTTKCFHSTDQILITYNHYPTQCFRECKTLYVDPTVGHLQHYRQSCPGYMPRCLETFKEISIVDNNLWRYGKVLIKRTVEILNNLGFISSAKLAQEYKEELENNVISKVRK